MAENNRLSSFRNWLAGTDAAPTQSMTAEELDIFMAVGRFPSTTAPHKAGKATTYSATGLPGIEPPDITELGSAIGSQIREIVPELSSPQQRRQTYAYMQNDAAVDVSLRTIKTPGLGAEYFFEPYSDQPNDILAAKFVEDNLVGGMSSPFINSLEDIYSFFENGKSVLEKVYEERPWTPGIAGANSKNYTMLRKLGVRPESTISKVNYDDNGGPLSVTHQAIRADGNVEEIEIPISKLLIFTFNRKGGNVDGKSILRTAYPHWYYKTHLYKIDAIQKERHSLGVPKGKLLPGFNKRDMEILRTLLRNIRTNEEAFMLLTPNVDIEFAKVEGNLVDVMSSIDHHNMMIMMNVMAQFLVVASASGARANAATQVDVFMKALRYIASYVADVINMYLIPELVVYNFPTTNFPKMRVKNLGESKDLQMLASAFANLLSQGALTPTLETENMVRRMFGLPQVTQQEFDAAQAAKQPDTTVNAGGQQGAVKPNADKRGNIGKSPSNAAEVVEGYSPEYLASIAALLNGNGDTHTAEFHHDTPIKLSVDASTEHEHDVDLELKLEEGSIQHTSEHQIDVHNQAPVVQVHTHPREGEVIVKHVKPRASNITKSEDGKSMRVEYEYDSEDEA